MQVKNERVEENKGKQTTETMSKRDKTILIAIVTVLSCIVIFSTLWNAIKNERYSEEDFENDVEIYNDAEASLYGAKVHSNLSGSVITATAEVITKDFITHESKDGTAEIEIRHGKITYLKVLDNILIDGEFQMYNPKWDD
jgi:nitrogen fixation-related uncharacterized protein